MSGLTERVTRTVEEKSVLDLLREFYHVPTVAFLVAFMFWVRARGWQKFVVDGQVFFSGNDAWYHLRMVEYTTRNWPFTMPFDPWTYFPYGTSVGQFGTLYDQLVATAALVVGLGSPTETQVALTLLFAPAVLGALTAVPVYLLGKRYGGRGGGVVATLLLALTPGQFFVRSLAGFSDHHVAETFFMAWAAVAAVVAVAVAEREKPIWELIEARDYDALRRPVTYGVLAGVAMALYIWVWPPGILFGGIFGVFLVVHLLFQYVRGVSPDFNAIVGATAFLTGALLTAVQVNTLALSASEFSVVQPALLFAGALGVAGIAWGARQWDAELNADRSYYPLTVVGLGVVAVVIGQLVAPDIVGFVFGQIERIVGLGSTATSLTVAEAQPVPLDEAGSFFFRSYGLAFFTALGGIALALYRYLTAEKPAGRDAFLLVWFVFLLLATLTQQRFDYYLVLPVTALNAYLFAWAVRLIDVRSLDDVTDLEGYQVLAIVAIVLIVAAPLAIRPGNVVAASGNIDANDDGVADGVTSVTAWEGSLQWMNDNSPEPGRYDSPDAQALGYYDRFDRTEDYEYSEGTYGTLAWWDYGHWMTVLGERIPNANPFQQGARDAANVLLAPNESYAYSQMRNEGQEETRYVMIDYQLGQAGTRKYSAPAAWETAHGLNVTQYADSDLRLVVYNRQTGRPQVFLQRPRAYESMRVRLFQFHGSATSVGTRQGVIVVDWDIFSPEGADRQFAVTPQDGQLLRTFPNESSAREFVERDGTAQIGGLPGIAAERVEALEHYRLVHVSERTSPTRQGYPWVKTFERVPGATVRGEGAPANTTIRTRVRMRMPNANSSFFYEARATTDADGTFEFTVPYSTAGYDNWGPEQGRTNVSVRAAGSYQVLSETVTNESGTYRYVGSFNVTEAQVIGEDDAAVTVEVRPVPVVSPSQDSTNTSDGSGSNGSGTDGSESTATPTPTPSNQSSLAAPGAARAR